MTPVIVTAFFDIGRGDFSVLSRKTEEYMEHFEFWARIQNEMVIYCESKNRDRIFNIRKQYGLEDKTTIYVIDEYKTIEKDILNKMEKVSNDISFARFRYYENALSNQSLYDYIMFLKWWTLQDAAKHYSGDTMMAWIDFGYNKGGDYYLKCNEFDYLWDYDFTDKINLFCLKNPDNIQILDSLQFQTDCFIGGTAIVPASKCHILWEYIKDSMNALLTIGSIDDDQMLLLMAYKAHKEEFNITICDWFQVFEKCSNHSFTTRDSNYSSKGLIYLYRKIKMYFRIRLADKNYLSRTYSRIRQQRKGKE